MSAKPSFFARRGIIVLMIIFFLVPFAMRGARMSVQGMKNDLRDWLPKDFPETAGTHFPEIRFCLGLANHAATRGVTGRLACLA